MAKPRKEPTRAALTVFAITGCASIVLGILAVGQQSWIDLILAVGLFYLTIRIAESA